MLQHSLYFGSTSNCSGVTLVAPAGQATKKKVRRRYIMMERTKAGEMCRGASQYTVLLIEQNSCLTLTSHPQE